MYKRFQRLNRVLKVLCVVTALMIVLTAGLYIWFVYNATNTLERLVHNKSEGALRLEISRLRFNFFTRTLSLRQATLLSTDTTQRAVIYNVTVPHLAVRVPSIWNMAVHGSLLLDSIRVNDPMVTIVRRYDANPSDTTSKLASNGLSITEEIGNVYYSLLNGLESFGINRITIRDAGFRMEDRTQPDQDPTAVSRVNLELVRGDAVATNDTLDNEQLMLDVRHQDIAMPGGRYRLGFRSFNLQLYDNRVLLDSCTLTALRTDSANSAYTVFFDSLILGGVDFGAMYRDNLLRADSVYCINPVFDIRIDNSNADTTKVPDPAKIIREFTSDMHLNYVAVRDAGIRLDVTGRRNRARVNSNADNFELRGLRVYADSLVPVSVQRFDLRVSDYQLFNRDSTTSYAFDSVHFHDDRIALTNFLVTTTSSKARPRNERNFNIPYFELTGLDWYQLIFEQNLRAKAALLRNADIHYTRTLPVSRPQKNTDFLASMQTLDSLVTLDRLSIQNGHVHVKLAGDQTFVFEDVNMFVNTNQMLKASGVSGLRSSVKQLSFSDGRIRYKNITAQLQDVNSEEGLLYAGKLTVNGNNGGIDATASNVYVGDVLLDNKTENVMIDGMRWSDASINIRTAPSVNSNGSNDRIAVNNVSGSNTKFKLAANGAGPEVQTFITSLNVASLTKERNKPVYIEGLEAMGKALVVRDHQTHVTVNEYRAGNESVSMNGVMLNRNEGDDSLRVNVPRVAVNANVNALLAGELSFSGVTAQSPDIVYVVAGTDTLVEPDSLKRLPLLNIGRVILTKPDIRITIHKGDSLTTIQLPRSENGLVDVSDISNGVNGMAIGKMSVHTSNASLTQSHGATLNVSDGMFHAALSDIGLPQKTDSVWKAHVDTLHVSRLAGESIGSRQGKLFLDSLDLGNVRLSSAGFNNLRKLAGDNARMRLHTMTGSFSDTLNTFNWYNLSFNQTGVAAELDSFQYHPTRSRDEAIAQSEYEMDYVTVRTGLVRIAGLNLKGFAADSALSATSIDIHQPAIVAYRDKKPPFRHGIIKPLPVDMVQRVRFPINLKRVNIHDGFVSYTERNARSRAEGTITLDHSDGLFLNIKNHNIRPDDSMYLSMNTRLMDSANAFIRVMQAYTDTLSSFRMSVDIGPAELAILNPVLAPLMNVTVASGRLDTFRMRAIGREHLSIGEAKMFYRNLRIRLVKDGKQHKSSLTRRLASLYVNTFMIKNDNRHRIGVVHFERDRERSFFNYIWKMTLSGMATSTGAKKNKKVLKKYEQELKRYNQEPIDFELSDPSLPLPDPDATNR